MRNEAVIAGVAHGGIEKPVDHKRAGVLVHLVFDRLTADWHFDDDIDVTRRIDPDRDGVNAHGWLRNRVAVKSWIRTRRGPRPVSRRFETRRNSIGPGEGDLVERLGPEFLGTPRDH